MTENQPAVFRRTSCREGGEEGKRRGILAPCRSARVGAEGSWWDIITDRDLGIQGNGASRSKGHNGRGDRRLRPLTCRHGGELQRVLDLLPTRSGATNPVVDDDNRQVGVLAQANRATRFGRLEKIAATLEQISSWSRTPKNSADL